MVNTKAVLLPATRHTRERMSYDLASKFWMMKLVEYLTIFAIGGGVYVGIEMLYRGYSHWTMFIVGGLCLIFVGLLNECSFMAKIGMIPQMMAGAVIITVIEFITGCIVNLLFEWNVWDYSNVPGNILGQVCLPFTLAWFFLAGVAIVVDDWLRWRLFDEPKPHYDLWYCHHFD